MIYYLIGLIVTLTLPWPFQNAPVHRVHRGYGDYNLWAGFHPAVDIAPPTPFSIIQNVYGTAWVYGTGYSAATQQWSLLLTETPTSTEGILYEHVSGGPTAYKVGQYISQLSPCASPPAGGVMHVHIATYDPAIWPPPGQIAPQPGHSNIIDQFVITDNVVFTRAFSMLQGIVFYPDETFPPPEFQKRIRGAVDFKVSPRSSVTGLAGDDSCGVRSIEVAIRKQLAYSSEYISTAYGPRTIFDWSNELVDCSTSPVPDAYYCLYEGMLPSSQFNINYALTNSSTSVPGLNGIDNIWTDPYNPQADYSAGIRCRGAWDTNLRDDWNSVDQSACENREACFPDGRYLIDVTALSHTGSSGSISLPVKDITSPSPIPVGIVVDNFIPHVDRIILYTTLPTGGFRLIYFGKWVSIDETQRNLNTRKASYLPTQVSINGNLGVAIRFSEHMDVDNLPAVWIEGEWGGEVRWSSLWNKLHWFFPSEMNPTIPSEYLYPDPTQDDYGHWVFYETKRYSSPGYVGSLTLNVGNASIPISGEGLDLAGNSLDPDPSTIAPTQTLTNSTSLYDGYEPDDSYTWVSAPTYWNNEPFGPLVWGTNGFCDFFIEINPEFYPQVPYAGCNGYYADCPWWHGFWVFAWNQPEADIITALYYPDGTYNTIHVPMRYAFIPENWRQRSYVSQPMISNTGDFYWYKVSSVDWTYDRSTDDIWGYAWGHVYCISRDLVLVIDEIVIEGSIYSTSDLLSRGTNIPQITNMEFIDDFSMQVDYWIALGPGQGPPNGNGYFAQVVLTVDPPENDNNVSSNTLQECILDCENNSLFLECSVFPNPTTSRASINFSTLEFGSATVQVFDITGRIVETLFEEPVEAGNHSINWISDDIASGVYFILLKTTSGTISTRAVVVH